MLGQFVRLGSVFPDTKHDDNESVTLKPQGGDTKHDDNESVTLKPQGGERKTHITLNKIISLRTATFLHYMPSFI